MRQKVVIHSAKTDRDLFTELPLGDTWPEAEIIQVWFYLYRNSKLRIPESWQATLDSFNKELLECVFGLVLDRNIMYIVPYAHHPTPLIVPVVLIRFWLRARIAGC